MPKLDTSNPTEETTELGPAQSVSDRLAPYWSDNCELPAEAGKPGGLVVLLGFRHYDPSIGRFSSQDRYTPSFGDIRNSNLYLYASGDPVDRTDPSGNFTIAELSVRVGIVAAVLGVAGLAGKYVYNSIGGSTIAFMNGARPINMQADPRIGQALNYMRSYSKESFNPLYADAADRMERGILDVPPTVKGNPSYSDRGATEQRPNLARELRITVISTGPSLNAADIAMIIFGEDQRRQGNLGQDANVLNSDVAKLQTWLNLHADPPPTSDWTHPR